MCGISGVMDLRQRLDAEQLAHQMQRMSDALIHRGPDSGGQWLDTDNGVALGFRRLAIIDLGPGGDQPMVSADQRYVISYNGEIYNYLELRSELIGQGVAFHGSSDTEVLLEAFSHFGIANTLKRLNGMFAIALWDREQRRLWLVRDRLGIKPLYYGLLPEFFIFASEIKALRAFEPWQPQIDRAAVLAFTRFNYIPAPLSIYQQISKLPPGALLSLAPNKPPELQYYWTMWDVAHQPQQALAPTDAVDAAETLMRDTVRRQMLADVPYGALLSGGIDSSTVAALMQAESTERIQTFTIGFADAAYDEASAARAVATHIGSRHTEFRVSASDILDLIPQLPLWYDEPFADSSALPTYLLSRLARQHVTVALSGDGGDEVFLGYNRYAIASALWRRMANMPNWRRRLYASAAESLSIANWERLAKLIPAARRPRQLGDKLHKLAAGLRQPDANAIYRRLVSQWEDPQSLVIGASESAAEVWQQAACISDFTERMAFLDTVTYLPDDILTKVDRASMAVSLEVRVPLLDHRLVEFAWRLPQALRLRGSTTKWLLREVCYRHLPQALVNRPKAGFAVPLDNWLRGPLHDWARDLLNLDRIRAQGIFEPLVVADRWQRFVDGKGNYQHGMWGVLQLQAWLDHWT